MPDIAVVAGQAAFLYSLMRPSHRLVRTTRSGGSGAVCGLVGVAGRGWSLVEGSVGPVGVVVRDVVDDEAFELSLVPDDGAVEQLASERADPSLGERVGNRCADRGA